MTDYTVKAGFAPGTVTVYDGATDEMVPVTQKWCDDTSKAMGMLAAQRGIARWVLGLNIVIDRDALMAMADTARAWGMK